MANGTRRHFLSAGTAALASGFSLPSLSAAIPNFLVLEWHWISNLRLWRNFVKEGEIIEKGFVTVPDRPGIGVEMDEEAARSAQIPGTPWFASGEGA